MKKQHLPTKMVVLAAVVGGLVFALFASAQLRTQSRDRAVADIKVADITVDKKDCRLWVTYQNVGTTTITATLREKTVVNGLTVEDTMQGFNLPPGQYFGHGVGSDPGYKLSGVDKTVTAMIDVDNVLAESNESNNTMTKTLGCSLSVTVGQQTAQILTGKPDLVSHLSFTFVSEGDDPQGHYVVFNANLTVTNLGPVTAGQFEAHLDYRVNDEGPWLNCVACAIKYSYLYPGEVSSPVSIQFTKRGTQTSGQAIRFRATADVHNDVAESNETNNVYYAWYQSEPLHK